QDRTMAGFAGRASRSLSAIAGKVLNARPIGITDPHAEYAAERGLRMEG
ncbi:hypothetical protein LCGC14_2905770, partial [marine sediment metagenome]